MYISKIWLTEKPNKQQLAIIESEAYQHVVYNCLTPEERYRFLQKLHGFACNLRSAAEALEIKYPCPEKPIEKPIENTKNKDQTNDNTRGN